MEIISLAFIFVGVLTFLLGVIVGFSRIYYIYKSNEDRQDTIFPDKCLYPKEIIPKTEEQITREMFSAFYDNETLSAHISYKEEFELFQRSLIRMMKFIESGERYYLKNITPKKK